MPKFNQIKDFIERVKIDLKEIIDSPCLNKRNWKNGWQKENREHLRKFQ